jgi:probable HAF family extracellular repeat protein
VISSIRRYRVLDLGVVRGMHRNFTAINNRGELAATLLNTSEKAVQAFLCANGIQRNLGTLGGSFSAAHALNNEGEVVGGALTAGNDEFHAFIFSDGAMHDLNEFIEEGSSWELIEAIGINDKGEIVGMGSYAGEDHTFLLTPE